MGKPITPNPRNATFMIPSSPTSSVGEQPLIDFVPGGAIARGGNAAGLQRATRAITLAVDIAEIAAELLDDRSTRRMVPRHGAAEHQEVELAKREPHVLDPGTAYALDR